MRAATRRAFESLVELCIVEGAELLVIGVLVRTLSPAAICGDVDPGWPCSQAVAAAAGSVWGRRCVGRLPVLAGSRCL